MRNTTYILYTRAIIIRWTDRWMLSTLDKKKEHVLRCIQLGMDLSQAFLVAECSVEDIDEIDLDPEFNQRVKTYQAMAEFELLEKHNSAMEIQLGEGKTTAAQWKLERLNPKKWGKGEGSDIPDLSRIEVTLVGEKSKSE